MGCTNVKTFSGTRVFVSADMPIVTPGQALTEADYAAVAWTEVLSHTELPSMGREHTEVTAQLMGSAQDCVAKGGYSMGSGSLKCVDDSTDAGLTLLKNAAKTYDNYSFKMEFADGTKRYNIGHIVSAVDAGGARDDIRYVDVNVTWKADVLDA